MSARYSFLAPEVIQTSAMDCGPAALKAFLQAHGINCSYERLRETCHTALDGTSIDAIEELCNDVGIDAVQHIVPPGLLIEALRPRLPAILIAAAGGGRPHFIVVWRMLGSWVQIMDPGTGRRWISQTDLLKRVYNHTQIFTPELLAKWLPTSSFAETTIKRLSQLISGAGATSLLKTVTANQDWRDFAALDLSVRTTSLAFADGGTSRNREDFVSVLFEQARRDAHAPARVLPDSMWALRELDGHIALSGVVFLASREADNHQIIDLSEQQEWGARILASTVEEEPESAFHELYTFFTERARLSSVAVLVAIVIASAASLLEFMLFRAALSSDRVFDPHTQRLVLAIGILVYFGLSIALEGGITQLLAHLGRSFEMFVRVEVSGKLSRLGDRYINSRPVTDLAQRMHTVYQVRALPETLFGSLRGLLDLAFTLLAIFLIDWRLGAVALVGGAAVVGLLFIANSALLEIDLRFQTQTAALLTAFLDALLGVAPVRTHGLEEALRVEQEALLATWWKSGRTRFNWSAYSLGGSSLLTTGVAIAVVGVFVAQINDQRALVLLLLWVLRLPSQIQNLATRIQIYPSIRNALLRILEPLRIADPAHPPDTAPVEDPFVQRTGVSMNIKDLTILAGGHVVLDKINLSIARGEHIAVVGRSGAGKSTLLSMMLGLQLPQSGSFEIEGIAIESVRRDWLRRITAWVDPSVQLWNRSLLYNIQYGAHRELTRPLTNVLNDSELLELLERLEHGLQTSLGSGGGRLSGGEGQRVRYARAVLRSSSRLVLLDEAFRGLERPTRRRFLNRTRTLVEGATLICATHDVHATVDFPRVIVVENGQIVEDGPPRELANKKGRYRQLLEADLAADRAVWDRDWIRARVSERGVVTEHEPA